MYEKDITPDEAIKKREIITELLKRRGHND
jgi:hypothetical protein